MKFGSVIDQLDTIGVQLDVEDRTDFVVYSYLLSVDKQGMHRHSSIASIHWYDDEDDEPLMTRRIISTQRTPLHDRPPSK